MKGFLKNQRIPIPYVSSPEHAGVLRIDRRKLINPLIEIAIELDDILITATAHDYNIQLFTDGRLGVGQASDLYIVLQAKVLAGGVVVPPAGYDWLWMYESELGGCLHVLIRHDIAFWGTIPRIIAAPLSDEKAAELLLNYGIEPLENTRVAQLMRAQVSGA